MNDDYTRAPDHAMALQLVDALNVELELMRYPHPRDPRGTEEVRLADIFASSLAHMRGMVRHHKDASARMAEIAAEERAREGWVIKVIKP